MITSHPVISTVEFVKARKKLLLCSVTEILKSLLQQLVLLTLINAERKCSMQREQCVKGLIARRRNAFGGIYRK